MRLRLQPQCLEVLLGVAEVAEVAEAAEAAEAENTTWP
jgi:hypothetical protein